MAEPDILDELVIEVERFIRTGWRWRAQASFSSLNGAEVRVLMIVSRHGQMSASDLADKMGVGRPATSSVIRRLRHQGYLQQEQDTDDHRRHLLSLTPKGEQMVEELRGIRRKIWHDHLQALSVDEQRILLKLIKKISESALASKA
ncbi:MarR family winged helix-turn-helix transcriptional regulator [Sulfobacillus thermosulfidooxidans]|uniref:MarR family winged helix-turn-helix transcriptional regulator n=1 Tax=Sulfobacillus thermosulfidooxidans TaxID=28034 RepID=UPI0006B5704B|nr:MarR family transcriptional regulator [Sulfobacillus thermosulfidooxidans]